jgi:triacylglycerol esterase/lipase EstA (alpha/beta hydrolase family)
MFAYCLNRPVICADSNGKRTYVINGIGNDNEDEVPDYIQEFCDELEEAGVENVSPIAVYKNQPGILAVVGFFQVIAEMVNIDVYSTAVYLSIQQDLEAHPLEDGEQLNLIGYSGGGQIALNVAEMLGDQVDNVILIGAPVAEIRNGSFKISAIYSPHDPFSWNVSMGYDTYSNGRHGHGGYFKQPYMQRTVDTVVSIID